PAGTTRRSSGCARRSSAAGRTSRAMPTTTPTSTPSATTHGTPRYELDASRRAGRDRDAGRLRLAARAPALRHPGVRRQRLHGEPHQVSAWEAMFAAVPASRREDWDEAIRIHDEALAERPDHPALLYNLACMEASGGRHVDALLHLQRAVELDPTWAARAGADSDFAAIRNEPGFP